MNSPAKVLIIDDELLDVDILGQEPEGLGYQTVSADNGEEALTKAAAEAPDLVLVDVMLPGMGGFTVCRRLKGKKG